MEAIGTVMARTMGELTDSPQRSGSLVAKPPIRMPTTAIEAKALHEWAMTPLPDQPRATTREISKHLGFMAATLPSKNQDEESGKMRVAVYSSLLADYSNEALSYMARRACETLDWFPTPRLCIEILREYRQPTDDRDVALQLCHHFAQSQFEAFITTLERGEATEEFVGSVPDQWRRIAMERGFLRFMPDGSFVIRPIATPTTNQEENS